jgi:putative hemolysin
MEHNHFLKLIRIICLAGLALGATSCQSTPASDVAAITEEQAMTEENPAVNPITPAPGSSAGIPNPASVYCREHGGKLEIRKDSSGAEYGVCVFPDGSECDEWAFFRGECKPAGESTPVVTTQIAATPDLPAYAFPTQINPAGKYLFYLHGKIIEDQGLPAVSPDFGEYQYGEILRVLSGHGFRVISEVRPKNADPLVYAQHVADQVRALLEAGVPAENITVLGASKGGGIAISVSNLLKNEKVNYVPMAICSPETVAQLINDPVVLYGNVLSIYDASDDLSGSCADLFTFSEGKGLSRHEEIVLNLGLGHGILYKPLDEWVLPVVEWAGGN